VLFWKPSGKHKCADESDRSPRPDEDLHVMDGFGGTWTIKPNTSAVIYPLQLDGDGWFYWQNGSHERTRPSSRKTNCIRVERNGSKIKWICCEEAAPSSEHRDGVYCLRRQQELPIFDVPSDSTGFSIALRDQSSGQMTSWSHGIPLSQPGPAAQEVMLRMRWQGMSVVLGAKRQPGRRTVLFARSWFVDSAGLDQPISLALNNGQRLPSLQNSKPKASMIS
jgi:hypothetical protein